LIYIDLNEIIRRDKIVLDYIPSTSEGRGRGFESRWARHINQRGTNWHIEFMLNGKRYSSTHDTPIQAKDWAMRKIVSLKDEAKRIDSGELPRHTLKELCDIYLFKVSKQKKGHESEKRRINALAHQLP
jgi:hypothetical protein